MQIEADFDLDPVDALPDWNPNVAKRVAAPLLLRSFVELGDGETTIRASASLPADPSPAAAGLLDAARSRNLRGWFVAGYGVARFLPDTGRSVTLDRPSIERMLPLFDATTTLTSTNFSRYFGDDEEKSRMFHRVLKHAMLHVEDLLPDIIDLELRGMGGVTKPGELLERDRFVQKVGREDLKVPGLALAHGYQCTIAWLADLVGHVLLESERPVEPEEMEGVVLVDEIDLYLHPVWQATLIPALRRTFPKMQFIVTTHSPVVLSGVAPHEVVRVASYGDAGDVVEVVHHPETGELVPAAALQGSGIRPDPRMMTGSEIFREHFGLMDPTPNRMGDVLRRYTAIANDPFRTEGEHQEMLRLRGLLKENDLADLPKAERRRKA
jgi:hypothetical protein